MLEQKCYYMYIYTVVRKDCSDDGNNEDNDNGDDNDSS